MLTIRNPILTLPDIGPGFLIVVRIDRNLAMVMNPEIVVRSRSRVQNGEPVKAVLQRCISVRPGLVRLAASIAIQTGSSWLTISKGRKAHFQADAVLLWQRVGGTNDGAIGMAGR